MPRNTLLLKASLCTFLQGLEETSNEALKALLCWVLRIVRGRLGRRGSLLSSLPFPWPAGRFSAFTSRSSSSLLSVTQQRETHNSFRLIYCGFSLTDPLKTEWNSTWVRVVWADCAEQVPLLLVVTLAQQLTFFQDKLVSFAQLTLTDAAGEAAEVVNAPHSSHYKLGGRYLLQTTTAFGGKQPEETQERVINTL